MTSSQSVATSVRAMSSTGTSTRHSSWPVVARSSRAPSSSWSVAPGLAGRARWSTAPHRRPRSPRRCRPRGPRAPPPRARGRSTPPTGRRSGRAPSAASSSRRWPSGELSCWPTASGTPVASDDGPSTVPVLHTGAPAASYRTRSPSSWSTSDDPGWPAVRLRQVRLPSASVTTRLPSSRKVRRGAGRVGLRGPARRRVRAEQGDRSRRRARGGSADRPARRGRPGRQHAARREDRRAHAGAGTPTPAHPARRAPRGRRRPAAPGVDPAVAGASGRQLDRAVRRGQGDVAVLTHAEQRPGARGAGDPARIGVGAEQGEHPVGLDHQRLRAVRRHQTLARCEHLPRAQLGLAGDRGRARREREGADEHAHAGQGGTDDGVRPRTPPPPDRRRSPDHPSSPARVRRSGSRALPP